MSYHSEFSTGFLLLGMEGLFLRSLSFAAVGASGALLGHVSILCLSEAQALDVPSL